MGQLSWTREAQRWLEEIHAYIAEEDPEAALRTVRGILERARILTRHRGSDTGISTVPAMMSAS